MIIDKFQWVFSDALRNTCGKDVKFGRCQRVLTPWRLGLALTATCASGSRRSPIALPLQYSLWHHKACDNQMAKPHGADFARR
jgi:hypothetical protein